MKKFLFIFLLIAPFAFGQLLTIHTCSDTTELKNWDGSGVVLLDKYGAGDNTGGGLFHRIDSTYAEGSYAFDYSTLDGLQWARVGLIDIDPTFQDVTLDSLYDNGGATFLGNIVTTFSGKGWLQGSYSSKISLPTGATTEMNTVAGEGTEDDFYIGRGTYMRTTGEDGKGFGLSVLVEGTNTTGTPTLEGAQIMAFLGSVGGSEAAHLKTAVGDATAGMYALWLKIGANPNAVFDAGSKASVLWIDDQLSGTISGENYGIYATTGGGVPDAFIGFETSSSGWSQFLYFDETAYNKQPVSNNTLKVLLNTTQMYIPLSTSSTEFIVDSIAITGGASFGGVVSIPSGLDSLISLTGGSFAGQISNTYKGKVFSAGSYGSKIVLPAGTTTEMVTIAGQGEEDDFYIGYGSYLRSTGEDGKPFGLAVLVEGTNTTGTPTMQGGQIMAFLGSVGGSEAAHLKTLGGDATAGMYALWLKTGANSNCVTDVGSRSSVLWVDNQMSGTINGEEYGVFLTTGASRPDAVFGFETTSSGYDQLFYFDETFNSGAGTMITTDAVPGTQDARIKVYYNATQYYIALYR